MRLVWHIVKKDFRRLAVPLACWALLVVMKGEVGVRALNGSPASADDVFVFQWLENTLAALDVLVCVLLLAALVQEDVLAGSPGFWATRPISGGRLLAAKLLGAVLMFGVLPVLIAARWWVVCGYGLPESMRAALAEVDVQALPVFGALALAALTKNMSQFLGWVLGLVIVVFALIYLPTVAAEWTHPDVTSGTRETRAVATIVLIAGAIVAALGFQFFARCRQRALVAVTIALGMIGVVGVAGWDFSGLWAGKPQTSPLVNGISVSVENAKFGINGSMDFVMRDWPKELGVRASADHVWRWADGTSTAAWSAFGAGWPGAAEWRALGLTRETTGASARAYIGSGPGEAARQNGMALPTEFFLWPEKKERLAREQATYLGDLHAVLFRPGLEFELPLRAGERKDATAFSVRIDRIAWAEGQWQVTLRESRPAWTNYGRQRLGIGTMLGVNDEPATGFALANRARGEAVKLWSAGQSPRKLLVGTQVIAWITLQCRVPRDDAEKDLEAPPLWLEGATLAVVRYREAGRFDHEVKVENFRALLEGAPAK